MSNLSPYSFRLKDSETDSSDNLSLHSQFLENFRIRIRACGSTAHSGFRQWFCIHVKTIYGETENNQIYCSLSSRGQKERSYKYKYRNIELEVNETDRKNDITRRYGF